MHLPFKSRLDEGLVEDGLALLIRWILLAFTIWLATVLVGGLHINGWRSTMIVALVLGLLNEYVRPFITRNALPMTILTFGLFLVLLNATLLFVASKVADVIDGVQFSVDGVVPAIFGALVISVTSLLLRAVFDTEKIAGDLMHRAWPRSRALP